MPVAPARGAKPSPRSRLAAAAPHIAFAAPPNAITVPPQLSFWGNDVHGDCVTAEEAFAKACHSPEIFISQNDVITWATNHGVLEGAYLTQVLDFMQKDGFAENGSVYDDGPYYSVDWTDATTLQSAISMGPVKIGIAADQIEAAWQSTGGKTGWFATGFHTDDNEDHCVSLCGYGTIAWLAQELNAQVPPGVNGADQGYALFTWDSIGIIDVPSMQAITHEAWLRNPTTVEPPPKFLSKAGASVTALEPRPDHIDLFATGTDGAVWSTWWESAPGWQRWFVIDPYTKMQPGATVSALEPRADHIDLFATGNDGAVWSNWWEPAPGWQKWFLIDPNTKMQPGATVTTLVPRPDHIDLFVTGTDGAVWSNWWEPAPGWQAWFLIDPNTKMQPGATVTALVPRPDHIDLFVTGTDGAVWSNWWEPGPGWQAWFLIDPEVKMQPGAPVTTLVPRPDHIDLFVTGTDGAVWSDWWEPAPGWQKWFFLP